MTSKVLTLNDETYQENLSKEGTFAVRLWAEWCMPCRMMSPIYEEVADKIADESLVMAEVNIDQFPSVAASLGVRSIPTVVVFKNGKEINRSAGLLPAPQLTALIQNS
ncbi:MULTISPECIES: thioredoxin family protein [Vibrio]|uniref:Thioredoxin n=2 Tax=Vibrio TaxID=662 RepID=A0A7X4RVD6_9VIBR|nr:MULTISPECIES: thioredoxin family protein [Vibrio]MBF9000301.1 thioredoxin family protein [Vibrio nitrifigilis]MZI94180.1 thiol reductase thioredoxin [Vibrio eleionomae]